MTDVPPEVCPVAGIKNFFRRIQIEVRSSKPIMKILVIVVIVLSMAALITLRLAQDRIEQQTAAMREEAAILEQENEELQEKIDNMDNVEGVQQIAEDELGLVDPDTVVIKPE